MNHTEINNLKKHIFIYSCEQIGSLGIYLADSKEDAIKSINADFWDNYSIDELFDRPKNEEEKEELIEKFTEILEEKFGSSDKTEEFAEMLVNQPTKPFNIKNAIKVWSWEEYQKEQGFDISERLLELAK